MQWRTQLTKKCGYCAVTFPTRISRKRLTVRPLGLSIHVHGRTGIPKWVAILRRLYRYDDSEISWDRIDWILCNPVKSENRIETENSALKRSAAMQGRPG